LHLRPLSDEAGKNGRGRYRGRTTRLANTLILTRFRICRMIAPFNHADGRTFRHRFGLNEIIETFETLDLAQFQKFSGFVRKNNGHFSSSSLADNRTIRLPDDEVDAFIHGTDAIFCGTAFLCTDCNFAYLAISLFISPSYIPFEYGF
jgi:hypothetical protein